MKVLVPVDSSKAALAPISQLAALNRAGVEIEALVLNVQPRFRQHVAQFTSRAAREALRAERAAEAMARAIEALSAAGWPTSVIARNGTPAAESEQVDEIMMGVGRHPAWLRWVNPSIAQGVMARTDIGVTVFARGQAGMLERYALPAGVAGLAALLLTTE